ncbi:MAG TPA: molybdopterin-binding protein [Nitrososphaeraceae archaeon]|nr:molybdopterin-binding protein [Nitrososphaeraceae archaeon]
MGTDCPYLSKRQVFMKTAREPVSQLDSGESNVELLSVGNELLSGTITNTNAQWISSKITRAGGVVKRITTVGDCIVDISHAVKECIERRPRWLIISGGLGPTYDDRTLQGLSSALGQELVPDAHAIQMLRKSYLRYISRIGNIKLNDAQLKMAMIPKGSTPIQNPVGSAPAVFVEVKSDTGTTKTKTRIFALPGVPKEMKALFSTVIMPQFKEIVGRYYFVESIFETVGVTEAMLAPTLSRLVNSYSADDIYLKTHPKGYTHGNRNSSSRPKPKPEPEPKLNIQIASKGKDKLQVETRYNTILGTLKEDIQKLGGKIHQTNPSG